MSSFNNPNSRPSTNIGTAGKKYQKQPQVPKQQQTQSLSTNLATQTLHVRRTLLFQSSEEVLRVLTRDLPLRLVFDDLHVEVLFSGGVREIRPYQQNYGDPDEAQSLTSDRSNTISNSTAAMAATSATNVVVGANLNESDINNSTVVGLSNNNSTLQQSQGSNHNSTLLQQQTQSNSLPSVPEQTFNNIDYNENNINNPIPLIKATVRNQLIRTVKNNNNSNNQGRPRPPVTMEDKAAVKIGAILRGKLVRSRVDSMRAEMNAAAQKIAQIFKASQSSRSSQLRNEIQKEVERVADETAWEIESNFEKKSNTAWEIESNFESKKSIQNQQTNQIHHQIQNLTSDCRDHHNIGSLRKEIGNNIGTDMQQVQQPKTKDHMNKVQKERLLSSRSPSDTEANERTDDNVHEIQDIRGGIMIQKNVNESDASNLLNISNIQIDIDRDHHDTESSIKDQYHQNDTTNKIDNDSESVSDHDDDDLDLDVEDDIDDDDDEDVELSITQDDLQLDIVMEERVKIAVSKIEAAFLGKMSRNEFLQMRSVMVGAATKIKSIFRGNKERVEVAKLKYEMSTAAKTIQSAFRVTRSLSLKNQEESVSSQSQSKTGSGGQSGSDEEQKKKDADDMLENQIQDKDPDDHDDVDSDLTVQLRHGNENLPYDNQVDNNESDITKVKLVSVSSNSGDNLSQKVDTTMNNANINSSNYQKNRNLSPVDQNDIKPNQKTKSSPSRSLSPGTAKREPDTENNNNDNQSFNLSQNYRTISKKALIDNEIQLKVQQEIDKAAREITLQLEILERSGLQQHREREYYRSRENLYRQQGPVLNAEVSSEVVTGGLQQTNNNVIKAKTRSQSPSTGQNRNSASSSVNQSDNNTLPAVVVLDSNGTSPNKTQSQSTLVSDKNPDIVGLGGSGGPSGPSINDTNQSDNDMFEDKLEVVSDATAAAAAKITAFIRRRLLAENPARARSEAARVKSELKTAVSKIESHFRAVLELRKRERSQLLIDQAAQSVESVTAEEGEHIENDNDHLIQNLDSSDDHLQVCQSEVTEVDNNNADGEL